MAVLHGSKNVESAVNLAEVEDDLMETYLAINIDMRVRESSYNKPKLHTFENPSPAEASKLNESPCFSRQQSMIEATRSLPLEAQGTSRALKSIILQTEETNANNEDNFEQYSEVGGAERISIEESFN